MNDVRLEDLGAIGDGRSTALVSVHGAVEWLCWPNVDGPSVFGRLLDPQAGAWVVRPEGAFTSRLSYLRDTNVLSTTWRSSNPGDERLAEVVDFMPITPEGSSSLWPERSLVRLVTCVRGPITFRVLLQARPGYAKRRARFRPRGELGFWADDGKALLSLGTSRPLQRTGEDAFTVTLQSGQRLALVLSHAEDGPAVLPPPEPFALDALAQTVGWWRRWAARARYDGPWRAQVVRSALAVRLLTFAPSGAIAAAATTSLPERPGGDLNWDYRYCWVRDSALTIRSLLSLGYHEEARAFVSWLLHATALTRPRIGVAYDLFGRPMPEERALDWEGYDGARPVRVGNGARDQLQLDAFGEVLDAVAQLCRAGEHLDAETLGMLRDFGRFVCESWQLSDHGIWEPRGPPQHHTFSLGMCQVALDRLLELQTRHTFRRFPAERFRDNRAQIRQRLLARGWNERLGSYVQTLDGNVLDASLLLLGWYGCEDPRGQRMRQTVRAVQRRLSPAPGLVYRYEQSLREEEGAFVICSFWLVEQLARGAGPLAEAERLFERALRSASSLGLMAEEVHPRTWALQGNLPQAFSHVGLISAALALEERRVEEARPIRGARGLPGEVWA